jgi:hypothetical protein
MLNVVLVFKCCSVVFHIISGFLEAAFFLYISASCILVLLVNGMKMVAL